MAKKRDADADVFTATEGFVEEFNTKPTFDEDGVQASAGIRKDGKEVPDPVPMSPPVGFEAPMDLADLMRQLIRSDVYQRRLDEQGFDTEEEAADFDIDDDPLPPLTFHEAIMFPPTPGPSSEPGGKGPQGATTSPPSSQPEMAGKEGGEGGGSPNGPPAAAPSDPTNSSSTSTST